MLYALLTLAGAIAAAAHGLFGRSLRESLPTAVRGLARTALRGLHSGEIG